MTPDRTYEQALVAMMPKLPELPQWPQVTWEYSDGRYSLSEEDADKVLDYLENKVTLYKFELDQYQEQLESVLDGFK